jgi:hypothetical protein
MASIESLRSDPPGTAAAEAAPPDGRDSLPDPAAFQLGHHADQPEEHRLASLLAFALAAERREIPNPDSVARLRREAEGALCDHAFRYLHNNIERIRRDAIMEHLGRLPRPPGMLRLITANLIALVLVGAAAAWLVLHPETLSGLTGFLRG